MTSIETYQEQIDIVKASIGALKHSLKLTITRLDGGEYEVRAWRDLDFEFGTVIIGSNDMVYMRTAGWVGESWCAAAGSPRRRGLLEMYDHMREQTSKGVTYRFLHEVGVR